MKLVNIEEQVVNFIMEAMESWIVEHVVRGQILADVKIQRWIFREDSLLAL